MKTSWNKFLHLEVSKPRTSTSTSKLLDGLESWSQTYQKITVHYRHSVLVDGGAAFLDCLVCNIPLCLGCLPLSGSDVVELLMDNMLCDCVGHFPCGYVPFGFWCVAGSLAGGLLRILSGCIV